ncbi:hypothetical protein ACT691_17180 [Vibrio metschnikovii]
MQQLTEHFAHKASNRLGLPLCLPSDEQIDYLKRYHWPGNVRNYKPSSKERRF